MVLFLIIATFIVAVATCPRAWLDVNSVHDAALSADALVRVWLAGEVVGCARLAAISATQRAVNHSTFS